MTISRDGPRSMVAMFGREGKPEIRLAPLRKNKGRDEPGHGGSIF
jgi:hypothetical protein